MSDTRDSMNADPASDARIAEWNATLASGDTQRIDACRAAMLRDISARIMSEDANYGRAGWTR